VAWTDFERGVCSPSGHGSPPPKEQARARPKAERSPARWAGRASPRETGEEQDPLKSKRAGPAKTGVRYERQIYYL